MNDIKKVLIGVGVLLLGSAIVFFFSKGAQVWKHVDVDDMPISKLQTSQSTLATKQNDLETKYKDEYEEISKAVTELEKVKRDILSTPVSGRATRQINVKSPQIKNVIWVNSYSDARIFKRNEKVIIVSPSAEIEATIGGIIMDTDQRVIFKANAKVAEEIGLSERIGVLDGVTIKRILPDKS